jgi:hypothetical protein
MPVRKCGEMRRECLEIASTLTDQRSRELRLDNLGVARFLQ